MSLKLALFSCFLCFSLLSSAQNTLLKINGFTEKTQYTYAYLFLSDRKETLKTLIQRDKFDFLVKKDSNYEMGILYFATDSITSYEDVLKRRRELGIIESKLIALDDTVNVAIKDDNINDAILTGGRYTNDLNAMNIAMKKREYSNFLNTHADSLVTLLLLKALLNLEKQTTFRALIDYNKIYNNFSEGVRTSKLGLEVKALLPKE